MALAVLLMPRALNWVRLNPVDRHRELMLMALAPGRHSACSKCQGRLALWSVIRRRDIAQAGRRARNLMPCAFPVNQHFAIIEGAGRRHWRFKFADLDL